MSDGAEEVAALKKAFGEAVVSASTVIAYLIAKKAEVAIRNSNLFVKAAIKIEGKRLGSIATPYIISIVALAFAGKATNTDNIESLVKSVGIRPNKSALKLSSSFDIGSSLAYVPAIIYLDLVKIRPDADKLMQIAKSIGIKPERREAEYVLKAYEEIKSSGQVYTSSLGEAAEFSGFIKSFSSFITKILMLELERTFENNEIREHLKELAPYLAALGVLIFTGRDSIDGKLNEEGIRNIVKAVGIEPEESLIYFLKKMEYGSATNIVYVPALFLIISSGKTPDLDSILRVSTVLDMPRDEIRAGYIIMLYNQSHPDL